MLIAEASKGDKRTGVMNRSLMHDHWATPPVDMPMITKLATVIPARTTPEIDGDFVFFNRYMHQ
jgi:hypothetical protein